MFSRGKERMLFRFCTCRHTGRPTHNQRDRDTHTKKTGGRQSVHPIYIQTQPVQLHCNFQCKIYWQEFSNQMLFNIFGFQSTFPAELRGRKMCSETRKSLNLAGEDCVNLPLERTHEKTPLKEKRANKCTE